MGVAMRPEKGFGVTIAGQTGSGEDATAAAEALGSFLEQMNMKVETKDGLYSLPETKSDSPYFPMLISWTTRQQWLLAASHSDLLTKPAAKPTIVVAGECRQSQSGVLCDLTTLQTLLKSLGTEFRCHCALTSVFGQWAFIVKIDEDGGAVHCHITGALPVLAVTASVLFPVFAKARSKAEDTASISNLRQLALAECMYLQDHDDKLPALKTRADIAKLLQIDEHALISPRTNEPYTANAVLFGKSVGVIADPATMILFYEKTPGADGSHCASFLDGHAMLIPATEWDAAKKKAKIP